MQSPCSVGSITTTDASLDERCTQMRVLRTGFVASTAGEEAELHAARQLHQGIERKRRAAAQEPRHRHPPPVPSHLERVEQCAGADDVDDAVDARWDPTPNLRGEFGALDERLGAEFFEDAGLVA